MGARVGRWTRTDLVLFQHGGISRFSRNMGFPRANTRRSLVWPSGLRSPGLCASPFWMEYKKNCLTENRNLVGWINNSTTVAVVPNTKKTNKTLTKPKFTKKVFIPIIVWLALRFGVRGKYLGYDGDVSRGRRGVLRGVRFKCSGLGPPSEGHRCLLTVDSGRGAHEQTSQWTETISDSQSLSQGSSQSLTFLATRTSFLEDNFSMEWGGGMVSEWFKPITFIVHFISIIIIASAPPQIIRL